MDTDDYILWGYNQLDDTFIIYDFNEGWALFFDTYNEWYSDPTSTYSLTWHQGVTDSEYYAYNPTYNLIFVYYPNSGSFWKSTASLKIPGVVEDPGWAHDYSSGFYSASDSVNEQFWLYDLSDDFFCIAEDNSCWAKCYMPEKKSSNPKIVYWLQGVTDTEYYTYDSDSDMIFVYYESSDSFWKYSMTNKLPLDFYDIDWEYDADTDLYSAEDTKGDLLWGHCPSDDQFFINVRGEKAIWEYTYEKKVNPDDLSFSWVLGTADNEYYAYDPMSKDLFVYDGSTDSCSKYKRWKNINNDFNSYAGVILLFCTGGVVLFGIIKVKSKKDFSVKFSLAYLKASKCCSSVNSKNSRCSPYVLPNEFGLSYIFFICDSDSSCDKSLLVNFTAFILLSFKPNSLSTTGRAATSISNFTKSKDPL